MHAHTHNALWLYYGRLYLGTLSGKNDKWTGRVVVLSDSNFFHWDFCNLFFFSYRVYFLLDIFSFHAYNTFHQEIKKTIRVSTICECDLELHIIQNVFEENCCCIASLFV